jgi:hypothetical protein
MKRTKRHREKMSDYESFKELIYNETTILLTLLEKHKHSRTCAEFVTKIHHVRAWLYSSRKFDNVYDVEMSNFVLENNALVDEVIKCMRKDVTVRDQNFTLRVTWMHIVQSIASILDMKPRTIPRVFGLFFREYHKKRRLNKDRILSLKD